MHVSLQSLRLGNRLYPISLLLFALGLILGFLVPQIFPPIAFIGDIYIHLLKLIVIPLLMTQIMVGVYGAAQSFAGRLAKTVLLFIAMFIVSFCITALLVAWIGPGRGVTLFPGEWEGELAAVTLPDFFKSIVPDNLFAAMGSGAILPCILFAFVAGLAASAVKAGRLMAGLADLNRVFLRMLDYIMYITPIGVFVLIGNAVAQYGAKIAGVCALYIGVAWLGCIVITVLVMLVPVWIYAHISPVAYIRRVSKIWMITLSTCSSAATLPNTIRVCNEEFGVPEEITGVVVPLGCTIHMCGGAVSFCLLGLFTMQMAHIPVTFGVFLYMLLVATLMNMAAPGIPGGGIVLGATYLTILGAPTGFIGMYSGIYRLLDMAYTSVNVTGDITANILLAASEKKRRSAS